MSNIFEKYNRHDPLFYWNDLYIVKKFIDELCQNRDELFQYNEFVKKEFKKIDSVLQSLEKNRNKQLQERIKILQEKKKFRFPFGKK